MPRRLCALGALALLSACIAPQPVLPPLTGDDVTILVHGYRGGFLKNAAGEIAWITPKQGLSEGDRSLAIDFDGRRGGPAFGELQPAGPLTRLTVLPFIIDEDPYGSFMDWAKDAVPGFVPWSYDWRRDIREAGGQLCSFIEGLGPKKRVKLLVHSMGGLVTLHCLRTGSEAVRSAVTHVVFFGTPFRGAPGQWDDLQLGTKSASNRRLMEPEALLTFSSSYELVGPRPDFFTDASGAPLVLDAAYLPETWIERGWGVFADAALKTDAAYRAQLEARWQANREFWASMGDQEGPAPSWKAMAVIGLGNETVVGWTVKTDGTVDLAAPRRGDGDGVVPATRAIPPKPIRATLVHTDADHGAMLRDRAVQAVVLNFLSR